MVGRNLAKTPELMANSLRRRGTASGTFDVADLTASVVRATRPAAISVQYFFERPFSMKTLVMLACMVAVSSAPALAADGSVSRSSLSKMGLSGMTHMTDQQGSSIRGQAVFYPPVPIIGRLHFFPPHPVRGIHFYPPHPIVGRSGR